MASVVASALTAVAGIIGLLIYTLIYNALNTAALGTDVVAMLTVVPIILGAVIVLGVASGFFALRS